MNWEVSVSNDCGGGDEEGSGVGLMEALSEVLLGVVEDDAVFVSFLPAEVASEFAAFLVVAVAVPPPEATVVVFEVAVPVVVAFAWS